MITQIIIGITGVIAIYLTAYKSDPLNAIIGSAFGLIGQPFWLLTSLKNEQYGISILSLLYTAVWLATGARAYAKIKHKKEINS